MKTATVKELKQELKTHSPDELVELCLRLSKFKKENKELLTYLLYESANEEQFIKETKQEIKESFSEINLTSYYYIKKSVRKILRNTKKYIRYSKKKETEVELLLYFCTELKAIRPSIFKNVSLTNIFDRQILLIKKITKSLHEDLQHDYGFEIDEVIKN